MRLQQLLSTLLHFRMIDRSIKVLTKSQLYQDFCYSHLECGILRDILILTNPPLCLIAAALKHREQFNQGGEVLNQDHRIIIFTLLMTYDSHPAQSPDSRLSKSRRSGRCLVMLNLITSTAHRHHRYAQSSSLLP